MLRAMVSWSLYPLLLSASLAATVLGIRAGYNPTLVVMATILVASAPQLLAQRLMPYEALWAGSPRDFGLDLLHMLLTAATTETWRALTLGGLLWMASILGGAVGGAMWPSFLPWWAQFAFALMVGDLGAYWVHRSCHRSDLLWRVHALHHSSSRLHLLSSGRNHPMNAILAYGSQILPITLLGAPVEVVALVSVFTAVNGMLQHANIDLKHGVLNHVFATADLHRWHHADVREDSDTNFGSNLILWDWIFRTRALPVGREIRSVGLTDLALPENFFHHLASPFNLRRWLASPEPELVPQLVPELISEVVGEESHR